MHFRAVLVPLCMLFAQARCRPAESQGSEEPLIKTISMALQEIRIALGHLHDSLPGDSCPSLNVTERVGLQQQPLSAQRLSTVHCYMQELSKLTPEVSEMLLKAAQFIKNVEKRLTNSTPQNCNLPVFKEAHNPYLVAKCFLELVLEESKSNL